MIKRIYFCDRCGAEYTEPLVKEASLELNYVDIDDTDKQYKWNKDLCPECGQDFKLLVEGFFKAPDAPEIVQEGNVVTISSEHPQTAQIRFTTDGSDPRIGWIYTEPFVITEDCTVKAVVENDGLYSEVAEKECIYEPDVAAPVISCENNLVSIVSDLGADTYYTIDGTDPTEESTPYEGIFSIDTSVTVKAISYKDGKHSSVSELECHYEY